MRKTPVHSLWKDVPTKSVDVGGTQFVYRELGPESEVPLLFLNHLEAELDRWDPRVVDGLAAKRRFKNMIKGAMTLRHPEYYLFFTQSRQGRSSAKAFLNRLSERTHDRDKSVSISTFIAQLKAIHSWGLQPPSDLSRIAHPVLVANGDHDKMVPSQNSVDLARRLPDAELVIYDDAGHGGIFQNHEAFVKRLRRF